MITGAGRGIGRAIALALSREGMHCSLTARTETGVAETAALLRQSGGTAHHITADLTDPSAPERIVAETIRHFGRLDVLINNAGLLLVKPFTETTMEDFDRLLAVNLRAPFALSKAPPSILDFRFWILDSGDAWRWGGGWNGSGCC